MPTCVISPWVAQLPPCSHRPSDTSLLRTIFQLHNSTTWEVYFIVSCLLLDARNANTVYGFKRLQFTFPEKGSPFNLTKYPSSVVPLVRKGIISSKWPSAISTANNCVLGNPFSKLVGSSPYSMCDRWSGPVFNRLGFTTTSKSYSWNNKSHLQIQPPNTSLLTRYFNAEWSIYILKWPPRK